MTSTDWRQQVALIKASEFPHPNTPLLAEGVQLRNYQVTGAQYLRAIKNCILADDCGLGKTIQSLAAFAMLRESHPHLKLLIISESGTLLQWEDEVRRFLRDVSVQVIVSPPAYHRTQWPSTQSWRRWWYLTEAKDINIVSQAIFTRDWLNGAIEELVAQSVLIYDEATALRNTKTQAHAAAYEAQKIAKSTKLLTATPIYKDLEDYFALMRIVDYTVFRTKKYFMEHFCKTKKQRVKGRRWTIDVITGFKNHEQFQAWCEPYVLRRKAKDVNAELPEVFEKPIFLTMEEDQQRIYNAACQGLYNVLDEGAVDIDDEEVDIFLAQKIKILTQIRQIQAVNHPELLGVQDVSSIKTDHLIHLLSGPLKHQKVLVYSRFRSCVDILEREIKKRLKIKVARVTGKESAKKRFEAQKAFHSEDGPRVMLITDAAQKGVNLQCAAAVIFYENPWSWGARNQIIGRICRIGSEHEKVLSILLMVKGSIDDHIYKILNVSSKTVEKTFGDRGLMAVSPHMLENIVSMMGVGKTADEALIEYSAMHAQQFEEARAMGQILGSGNEVSPD